MAGSAGRKVLLSLIFVATMFAPLSTACADPPPMQLRMVTSTARLSAEDQATLDEYTSFWINALGGDDVDQRFRAAEMLIDPPANNGATDRFLDAYADATISGLQNIVENGDELQAVQAMRCIGFIGTFEALEVAVEHADSLNESRDAVRLWGAKASGQLIRRTTARKTINGGQLDVIVREISNAANAEKSWLVLHWMLEALFAADVPSAHTAQIRVLTNVIKRMADAGGPDINLMWTYHRALVRIRAQYLDYSNRTLPQAQRNAFIQQLATPLTDVLRIVARHWETSQSSRQSKAVFHDAVLSTETMLILIDKSIRVAGDTPSTSMVAAWDAGSETDFNADINRWNSVVTRPPYKN